MSYITVIVSILLSFCSTAIMGYIAMATGLGPWIEATLVLCGMLIFSCIKNKFSEESKTKSIGLATAAGGIGGILATACGFSFPTLFFLDATIFCSWVNTPLNFVALLGGLALAAGSFGLIVATLFESTLIERDALPFPIGELVYKMISAQDNMAKAWSLALGFIGTQIFLILRTLGGFIGHQMTLIPSFSLGITSFPRIAVQMDLLPMYWSIGFVTGHVIAIPLLLGFLATIFCIGPLHHIYPSIASFFQSNFFLEGVGISNTISLKDFTIAFCSGMVLYGAIIGFLEVPGLLRSIGKKMFSGSQDATAMKKTPLLLLLATVVFNGAYLWIFDFSLLGIIYLLAFTCICAYQMMYIAGKIGLAPLGRFATFVMVPGMIAFGYTPLQITLVSTYVEIAGGVACDTLFGRKMASLASIETSTIQRYQWLGLFISALCVGGIFWLLISHFGIGIEPGALAASRAASRALLVSVKSFDPLVLALGALFGYVLKFAKVNTALMLGGILMPPDVSLMLILGGASTYLIKNREEYYPLCSGIFAANSLWMLIKAFF